MLYIKKEKRREKYYYMYVLNSASKCEEDKGSAVWTHLQQSLSATVGYSMSDLSLMNTCQVWVQTQPKAEVVSRAKNVNSHCSELVTVPWTDSSLI